MESTSTQIPQKSSFLPIMTFLVVVIAIVAVGIIIVLGVMRLQALKADFSVTPTPKPQATPYVNPFKPTEMPTLTATPSIANPFVSPNSYQNPFTTTQNATSGYSNPFDQLR